jgi:hypothetical protein
VRRRAPEFSRTSNSVPTPDTHLPTRARPCSYRRSAKSSHPTSVLRPPCSPSPCSSPPAPRVRPRDRTPPPDAPFDVVIGGRPSATDRKFKGPFVAGSEVGGGTGCRGRAEETRRRGPTRARECGGRAARAQGAVRGCRDARMGGEGREEDSRLAGRGREPQRSKSSGKDWPNSKSGTGSGSAGSKAGV